MFDLGWTEMVLVGIVALIVVGPKELPGLFRSVGQFVGRARGMAREFTRAMESAADESGMREIDRTLRAATRPMQYGADRLRDVALGKPPAPKLPAAGTPLEGGTPAAPPMKPGGETAALAADRDRARAESRAADAERRAAAAERRAAEAPPADPAA